MYIVSNLIKVTIPNYLAGLPIPDSIGGWFRLGGKFELKYLKKNSVMSRFHPVYLYFYVLGNV